MNVVKSCNIFIPGSDCNVAAMCLPLLMAKDFLINLVLFVTTKKVQMLLPTPSKVYSTGLVIDYNLAQIGSPVVNAKQYLHNLCLSWQLDYHLLRQVCLKRSRVQTAMALSQVSVFLITK
jgi:hypothetical protein